MMGRRVKQLDALIQSISLQSFCCQSNCNIDDDITGFGSRKQCCSRNCILDWRSHAYDVMSNFSIFQSIFGVVCRVTSQILHECHLSSSLTRCRTPQRLTMAMQERRGGPAMPSQAKQPQVYQIDFTAVASGKRIASTKRRVRW